MTVFNTYLHLWMDFHSRFKTCWVGVRMVSITFDWKLVTYLRSSSERLATRPSSVWCLRNTQSLWATPTKWWKEESAKGRNCKRCVCECASVRARWFNTFAQWSALHQLYVGNWLIAQYVHEYDPLIIGRGGVRQWIRKPCPETTPPIYANVWGVVVWLFKWGRGVFSGEAQWKGWERACLD